MGIMSPWVMRLLIANVAIYFLLPRQTILFAALMYYPPDAIVRPWTIVTYMFLHGGTWHLLGNMIGLYFFGPRLEQRLGGRAFLSMYFIAGASGALAQTVFATAAPMIGASGGVYGVLVGFAMFWPRERVLIFPLPVPIQAQVLIGVYIILSVVQGVGSLGGGVAHFAHLGGAAGAFVFIRWAEWRRGSAKRDFRKKLANDATPSGIVGDRVALARWKGISVEGLHELNREEVQRLMAKVGADGAASLTSSEREFLDRMSRG